MAARKSKKLPNENDTQGSKSDPSANAGSEPVKPEVYIELAQSPDEEFDLECLRTGEIIKLIGRRQMRMNEIAEICSHNLLENPQTARTFKMLNKANNEATRLFFQGVQMIQSIKSKRATDDVVHQQILKDQHRRNRENGLDYFGLPLPGHDDEDEYDEEEEDEDGESHTSEDDFLDGDHDDS